MSFFFFSILQNLHVRRQGAAHHEKDQAYEEAAFLQTNRFVAAYVVDEHSRMSYVNDILNEGFQQVGV